MPLHQNYMYTHQGAPDDALIDLLFVHTIDLDQKFYRSHVAETKEDVFEKITKAKPEWKTRILWDHQKADGSSGRLFKVQVGADDNKNWVWVGYWSGTSRFCNVRILSGKEETADEVYHIVTGLVPIDVVKGNKVKVTFWWKAAYPSSRPRHLEVVEWSKIRGNYGEAAAKQIDQLVKFRPRPDFVGGKLALLHGTAGTGKTTLIRALAKDWSDWCDVEYITDPEKFFGDASYMIQVLMENTDDGDDDDGPPLIEDDCDECMMDRMNAKKAIPRWRLVVLEDCGEFLAKTPDDAVNQSLSRLLNLSDGLMGQGLRVFTLLTTNQKLTDIHPAVQRPGRCLANIEVPRLTASEASKWAGHAIEHESTLAELYLDRDGENEHFATAKELIGTGQYL